MQAKVIIYCLAENYKTSTVTHLCWLGFTWKQLYSTSFFPIFLTWLILKLKIWTLFWITRWVTRWRDFDVTILGSSALSSCRRSRQRNLRNFLSSPPSQLLQNPVLAPSSTPACIPHSRGPAPAATPQTAWFSFYFIFFDGGDAVKPNKEFTKSWCSQNSPIHKEGPGCRSWAWFHQALKVIVWEERLL